MLKIEIYEHTPANMLRAIRAACNELLGETTPERQIQNEVVINLKNDEKAALHVTEANRLNAAANSELDQAAASLSARNDAAAFQAVPGVDIPGPTDMLAPADADPSVERDSTGAEWNPELHASTKAKNQDGTWKKRRGAGKAEDAPEPAAATPALPPLPPTVPVPSAPTAEEDMRKVYALITSGICTLNDAIDGAKSRGFVDLGAFSRDATPEQRAQLLAQLTKEVA